MTQNLTKSEFDMFHKQIRNGNFNEIKQMIDTHPTEKHFYNKLNESAAATAMKFAQIDIYEYFLLHGIYLGHHEDVEKIVEGMSNESKREFRCLHKSCEKNPNSDYFTKLISRCMLSHNTDEQDRKEFFDKIIESLATLNKNDWITNVLQVVAFAGDLELTFDFYRHSIEHMDPTVNRNVEGLCYHNKGHIYIGAKGLLDEENSVEYQNTLGVIAHELSHYALQLVYLNDCKPYRTDQTERSVEFDKILRLFKTKSDLEPYVEIVYRYPKSQQVAELIVRVPHLSALYKNNEEKFANVYEEFIELFKFYEEYTLVDLKLEVPSMKAKHEARELNELLRTLSNLKTSTIEMSPEGLQFTEGLEIIESASTESSNKNLNAIDQILFISSNCPKLTIHAIYQQVRDINDFESFYIFADLEAIKNETFFDSSVKALQLCTQPNLIVNCDKQQLDEVKKICQKFSDMEIKHRIIFVTNKSPDLLNISCLEVNHNWNHLAKSFQQNLLQRKICFEGVEMSLGDLMTDLSLIESIPFKDFLDNQIIKIGKVLRKRNFDEYVERKFLPSNSKEIEQKPFEDFDIEYDFNDVLDFNLKFRTILLFDEPGMGKSTSFKILHSRLREKYLSHWIVFMDLKEHCKSFQADNKITIKIKNCEEIVKFFCDKILKIQSFEAQVFSHLFNDNRVIVLMDGLDEICPSYKKFVFDLMIAIQKLSKNQLWISTRPHLVSELKNILNPFSLKLKPFTRANRKEFFENFFTLRDKEDQNIEQKLKKVEEFLEDLQRKSFSSLSNPLLFKMIAECFDDDHNLKLSNVNLFSIYDQFTTKMVERSMEKGPEAWKSLANAHGKSNIIDFYQKNAFQICFGLNEDFSHSLSQIADLCFRHVSAPSADDIARVGLMFSDGAESLHFIHRTFAEFYIAKLFYETIFLGNFRPEVELKAIMNVFADVLTQTSTNKMIVLFIDNAIESFADGERLKPVKLVWKDSVEITICTLLKLIKSGNLNLIKTLTTHLHPKPTELLLTRHTGYENLLMTTVEYQSIAFNEILFELLEEVIGSDEVQKMLLEKNSKNKNIFHFAVRNRSCSEVFNFLCNKIEAFTDRESLIGYLIQGDEIGDSIVQIGVKHVKDFKTILEILSQKLNLTQLQSIMKWEKNGNNLLHFTLDPENYCSHEFDSMWNFLQQIFDKETLHKLMMQRNESGLTPFDIAIETECEVFSNVKNAYVSIFGETELWEMVLNTGGRFKRKSSKKKNKSLQMKLIS